MGFLITDVVADVVFMGFPFHPVITSSANVASKSSPAPSTANAAYKDGRTPRQVVAAATALGENGISLLPRSFFHLLEPRASAILAHDLPQLATWS